MHAKKRWVCAGVAALWLAHSAEAATLLYGVSFASPQGSALYEVSLASGQATNGKVIGLDHVAGLSFGPGGHLYALTNATAPLLPNSLVRIDRFTGAYELVGATGLGTIAEGDLAYDRTSGSLYGLYNVSAGGRQLFKVSAATGAATLLPVPLAGDPSALCFDATGKLYLLDTALSKLYTVDKTSGATLTTISLSRALGSVAGMAIDPATGYFYVADGDSAGNDRLYRLTASSGYLTSIGATGLADGLGGLAFLPEPGSLLLLAMGAGMLRSRHRGRA